MDEIECPKQKCFLGLSEAYGGDTSYFHIIPVPYDGTCTYMPGSRMGPRAIIDASAHLELYDHDLDLEPASVGICTHPETRVFAADPERMLLEIQESVGEVFSNGKLPVVVGGEHTVSLGAVRALASREQFSLVCLDAHADLRDTYQGTPYSHACFLRRAREHVECRVFGVRSLSREQADYAMEAGINIIYAERLAREGSGGVDVDYIPQDIYLSIDLDVLDPSIMPATGAPEPGGLGWYEAVNLLGRIIAGRRVLGFDVVELCPLPGNPAPDFTAAKLIHKVMGLILKSSKNRREDWIGHGKEKIQEETAR
jgi:agmatinase